LAYADKYWNPTWEGSALHYPRHDAFVLDGKDPASNPSNVWLRVQVLTGNALLGLARINVKDGIYTLYNEPWGEAHFREPFVSGVPARQRLSSRRNIDRRTVSPSRCRCGRTWPIHF
jgi:hypothetical protein